MKKQLLKKIVLLFSLSLVLGMKFAVFPSAKVPLITAVPSSSILVVGKSITITANALDSNSAFIFSCSSSDSEIISLTQINNSTCLVTGLSSGIATVIVQSTSGGICRCIINCYYADESYINNDWSGHYLLNRSGAIDSDSGLLAAFGNAIQWEIIHVENDCYVIRSKRNTALFLSGSVTTTDPSVSLAMLNDNTIPNHLKWRITTSSRGGKLIQNISTGKYLTNDGGMISSTSLSGTRDSPSYRKTVWRVADTTYYGDSNAYPRIELPSDFCFKQLFLFSGDHTYPQAKSEYNNVLWRTADNFSFSDYSSEFLAVNDSTGDFCVNNTTVHYAASIVATHKVTNRITSFHLIVNPIVKLVGVAAIGHDHYSALESIQPSITSCGYTIDSIETHTGAFSTNQLDNYLRTNINNVFVSRSHGGIITSGNSQIGTCLILDDRLFSSTQYCSNGSIASQDLSNMKLILFIACDTGAGGETGLNLPAVAVAQGAVTAVGFTGVIGCSEANNWTVELFELLENGYSISAACAVLGECAHYQTSGLSGYVVCGDGNTRMR